MEIVAIQIILNMVSLQEVHWVKEELKRQVVAAGRRKGDPVFKHLAPGENC
jgi:hypothetical protein